MPTDLTWGDIALRLILTVIAGAVIGVNREEHGRPAGLRTTMLVCLAASVAMIQTNLLLTTGGKKPDSFVVMDVMRLPLGILSGMGFIGAGAILRRDNLVIGVTTAATLWFVTVMGLCFGGGQIWLGLATLALGVMVLGGLKKLEKLRGQDLRGALTISIAAGGPAGEEISRLLNQAGCKISSSSVSYANETQMRDYEYALRWREHMSQNRPPPFVESLAVLPGVSRLSWKPT
jgi:putative Mg2+ transporter-C (MgtC) family protein